MFDKKVLALDRDWVV